MGQSKGGGYKKLTTATKQQQTFLNNILQQANPNLQQAAQGYAQFLPGGGGGEAIANAAQQRFQQQTLPSIMNAFGSGAKTSSALNQALAAGGANLNTDIASILSQLQLNAAQGMGNLGLGLGNIGTQSQFAYAPRQMPFWQQFALAGIGAGGETAKGLASNPALFI